MRGILCHILLFLPGVAVLGTWPLWYAAALIDAGLLHGAIRRWALR